MNEALTATRKVLLATDFSAGALGAQLKAVEVARALGAELVALHAWSFPVLVSPDGVLDTNVQLGTLMQSNAEELMHRLVADLESSKLTVRGVVKMGDAWRAIVDTAKDLHADLIVIGTHGRRGLPRLLIGSVAEKVIRMASCPVLTVPDAKPSEDAVVSAA